MEFEAGLVRVDLRERYLGGSLEGTWPFVSAVDRAGIEYRAESSRGKEAALSRGS